MTAPAPGGIVIGCPAGCGGYDSISSTGSLNSKHGENCWKARAERAEGREEALRQALKWRVEFIDLIGQECTSFDSLMRMMSDDEEEQEEARAALAGKKEGKKDG